MSFGQNTRRERKKCRLTLKELAALSNVSDSMLSMIEREHKNPTLNIAIRIARALNVPLSDLIEEQNDSSIIVMRNNQRKYYLDPESEIRTEHISAIIPFSNIELVNMALPPKLISPIFPPHPAGVKEYIFVNKGAIKLFIDSAEYDLYEGDFIYYESNKPLQVVNLEDEFSLVFIVIDRSSQK